MIDGAAMLNGILQDIANLKGANVLYADTASRFADAHISMDGVHPKDGYVGRMAQEIKRSLGFHSQKASPKSFIQPKRNDQPQSRYNFSHERQPPRQPPQHQQQPVSVPQKLAAAPVWNNVSTVAYKYRARRCNYTLRNEGSLAVLKEPLVAGREMPQIHGNWALGDKFLQICMILHMGIGYSKTTANKVGRPLATGMH